MQPSWWKTPWSWLPSVTTALLAFFLLWGFLRPLDWDDLGWHIRVGNWILENGAIPRTNILVWTTPEHPFVTHEWLSEVIFALLDRLGGVRLLLVTRAIVFAAAVALLADAGRRVGAEPLTLAFVTLVAAWGLATQATLRPWLFTNFLVVLQLWILVRAEKSGRTPWELVPIYLVWVNLHGGFVEGLGILVWRLADRVWALPPAERLAQSKRYGALAVACTAACFANPHGPAILLFPLRYLLAPADGTGIRLMKESITEWLPITFGSMDGGVWIVLAVLLALALIVAPASRRDSRTWLSLALLALCLRETRHLAIAAALAHAALSSSLLVVVADRMRGASSGFFGRLAAHSQLEAKPRTGFVLIVLAIAAWLFLGWQRGPGFERRVMEARRYPLDAFAATARLEPRRLFHFYEYCGPLAWKGGPAGQPLFVVGIHDAQPESLFSDYLRVVHRLDGWPDVLARWEVDVVLMPATHPLVAELRQKSWAVAFEDASAVVLQRP